MEIRGTDSARAARFFALGLMIAAASAAALARQTAKQPKASRAQGTLSEPYAKAARAALALIKADDTVPHIDNGKPLGDKNVNAAIDAAGALAKLPAETSATDSLNAIYRDKLLDNDRRNTKKMAYESDSGLEDEGTREMTAQQEMLSDSELQEMDQKEKACFDALDAALQARSSVLPAACISWSPAVKSLQKSE
jgi:hypothetical protein